MDKNDKVKQSPKQFVGLVILILMAMVISFIEVPLIPGLDWLLYDFSGAIAALACLLYTPWIGAAVAILAWIPHLVTDPLGALMNIMHSVAMVIVMGLVYRNNPSFKNAILGVVAGIIAATLTSICLNFVVTPFYLSTSYNEIVELVLPALLPFNLAKATVNGAIALVAYRKLRELLVEEAE